MLGLLTTIDLQTISSISGGLMPNPYFSALLAIVLLCPTVSNAQSQKPKRAPLVSATDKYLFAAPPMKSERFRGEISSDHDLFYDQDVFPDREGRRQMAWTLPAESQPQAERLFQETVAIPVLAELGFVPLNAKDLGALKSYRGAGEIAFMGKGAGLFRAKDAETLKKAAEKLSLIGSRELGKLSAFPSQIFVEIRPGSFYYDQGKSHFIVKVVAHLYGIKLYEAGGTGEVGFFEATEVSTADLTDSICGAFRVRRRGEAKTESNVVRATPESPIGAPLTTGDINATLQQIRQTAKEIQLNDVTLRFAGSSAQDLQEVRPRLVRGTRVSRSATTLRVDLRGMEEEIPTITSFSNTLYLRANSSICTGRQAPVLVSLGLSTDSNSVQIDQDCCPTDRSQASLSEVARASGDSRGFFLRKKWDGGLFLIVFPESQQTQTSSSEREQPVLYVFRSR